MTADEMLLAMGIGVADDRQKDDIFRKQVDDAAKRSALGLNVLHGTVLQGDCPPRRLLDMSIALRKMPEKHSDFH